ncbi:hypothetical protein WJX84_008626 [Apatococcus fuscideae]|uniref:CBM20 domain-containing protein n=1 Tax=Apatococcus fuscideae TaxID=2026836 RepID=A0AAW1RKP8_9CHLO
MFLTSKPVGKCEMSSAIKPYRQRPCHPLQCTQTIAETNESLDSPVNISFSTHYQAAFGEKLKLVGSHEATGSWDLDDAPDMQWTDGNVWKANLEVPSGTELEYKVVHVHHSGVRWESIDNRVLVVTPEAGSSVQDSQEAVTNGSTSDQTADSSGASDGQAGVLRAMDVTTTTSAMPPDAAVSDQELSWKLVTVADQADIIVATQSLAADSDGNDSGPLDPNADSPEQLEAITAFLDAPRKPAALSTLEDAAVAGLAEQQYLGQATDADEASADDVPAEGSEPKAPDQSSPAVAPETLQPAPGVKVVEQQNGPGQLPTFLYSFDEHQDMQPFVETESEDETETSAKLKTETDTSQSHSSRPDLQQMSDRAVLPQLNGRSTADAESPSVSLPLMIPADYERSPGSGPIVEDVRAVAKIAAADANRAQGKRQFGVGQVVGVAAMGVAAGLVASGVSVELADAAVISALIAAGAAVLPSATSTDEEGKVTKKSLRGKDAGDAALGALAMGINAAEGIARTFGLARKQDDLEPEQDAAENDDSESDWEESQEEWASPVQALMSATEQLAASIMEAQGMDGGNVDEAEAFAANYQPLETSSETEPLEDKAKI